MVMMPEPPSTSKRIGARSTDDLANQLGQFGNGSALLAAKDIEQCLLLRLASALVEIKCDAEIALQDIARDVRDHSDGAPRDMGPANGAMRRDRSRVRNACR
jgi:hypothetical protein